MRYIVALFLVLIYLTSSAQFVKEELPDSAFAIPMIKVSYAYQWPEGDMIKRYGNNSNLGGSFAVKTKNNWFVSFKGNFIWSDNVNETDLLSNIATSDGSVIDNEGRLTDIFLEERGSSFFLTGGRVFTKFGFNKNSGVLVYAGPGILHHQISIKYRDEIESLNEDLMKGYDKLSMGFAVNGFLGYIFFSKNRFLNFFGGADFTQAWTKSLRGYDYKTRQLDNEINSDFLFGLRAGWIIRLNKRKNQDFYYN